MATKQTIGFADRIVGLKRIKAGRLKAHPQNWRKHPDSQKSALRAVLEDVGWIDAIVARKKGRGYEILDGHLRAELDPEAEVPVLLVDLDDQQALKVLATHDPLGYLAETDPQALESLVTAIESQADEIEQLLQDANLSLPTKTSTENDPPPIDKAAELQKKWKVKRGQLWEITGPSGNVHRLLCGDSTEPNAVAVLMDGGKADVVFTSPPYLQQRDYGKKIDDWDGLMQGVFGNLPVHEKTQVLVNLGVVHRDGEWVPYWDGWIEWMRAKGWRRFGWYVWDKLEGMPGNWNGRLAPSFEFIFHFNYVSVQPAKFVKCKWHGTRTAVGSTNRQRDGSLKEMTSAGDPVGERRIPDATFRAAPQKGRVGPEMQHPAPFSVALAETVISCWTGLLYDAFLGSGTTIVAAEQLGRICYGMEIEPKYCAVILERMANLGCTCRLAK